ncbi:MAG: alpha-glucosidase [Alicyclobacillaceae bacterium]|nr:alpha-glucosidase [Alicyclobacillaceae bacterium]
MLSSETIRPDRAQPSPSEAIWSGIGQVTDVVETATYLRCVGERGRWLFQAVANGVLRLRLTQTEQDDLDSTAALVPDAMRPEPFCLQHSSEFIEASADGIFLTVPRDGSGLTVAPREGDAPFFQIEQMLLNELGEKTVRIRSHPKDRLFGLGEKPGPLNKQGERYTMWNSDVYAPHVPEMESLYVSIPFVLHMHHETGVVYGLFLDCPGKSVWDARVHPGTYEVTATTGDFDAYLFSGDSVKEVISRYTTLTGRMPMPPVWALGYHQSRYGYQSAEDVLAVAETMREKHIPCDAIHLDIHYMRGYRSFTFDEDRFPNPRSLVCEMTSRGIHLVPIVDPGVKVDDTFSIYHQGLAEDCFCKYRDGTVFFGDVWPEESVFPDFTNARVRDWWAGLQHFYTDLGIEGIWNDMNEPAVFNETKTMDVEVMHQNDGHPKTHGELHNLYGLYNARATYEGLVSQLGDKRPFVLTRAGYAGVQRYAAVWTGDNRSFWEHMEMSISMLLNMGLSGIPFAGADVGGFAHHATGELLARWTQMGAFLPFFRNHSALDSVRQEPWQFGPEVEAICRHSIERRYRLIPYLYAVFREAAETGVPIVRPLFLEFPHDFATHQLSDQFLVGASVLVAPVLRPGVRKRLVYLPAGDWYALDGQHVGRFRGEQYHLVDAPLESIPVFVQAGSVLPEHELQQHLQFSSVKSMTLVVYGAPSHVVPPEKCTSNGQASTSFTSREGDLGAMSSTRTSRIYEDDGETFAYQSGSYNDLRITVTSGVDAVSAEDTRVLAQSRALRSTDIEVGSDKVQNLCVSFRYEHQGYTPSYRFRTYRFEGLSDTHSLYVNHSTFPLMYQSKEEFEQTECGWTILGGEQVKDVASQESRSSDRLVRDVLLVKVPVNILAGEFHIGGRVSKEIPGR